ncbi:tyrosinase [Aspergillus ellipticus CBS 707.79]|uniref:Tyrosinase n=1 Tax=Aspergillus ellipticus CBS 707.79 TaxID=1448320 RepID=A0A319DGV8_9EURO|nr:tyrosinase [Aspergillus ellipticus CBS 707.79]
MKSISLIAVTLALGSTTYAASIPKSARAAETSSTFDYYNGTCTSEKVRIRKEWRDLTGSEQKAYLAAENCLISLPAKSGLAATTNRFSDLQALHRGMTNTAVGDIIHDVGQFLPWHRYYMHVHETLLRQECNYTGPLTYWDERLDADTGDMFTSPMWNSTGFGGNGIGSDGCVVDGAFANYTEHIGPENEDTEYCLNRAWDNSWAVEMANSTVIYDICGGYNTYSPWWYCIAELAHKGVHTAVGGVMADIKSSPGDPMFFMHHTYIDKVWFDWQKGDPTSRLYQISGPAINESANAEPAGGYPNTTLSYVLSSDEILPNVTVETVMNPMGGYLCYDYLT